MSNSFSPQGEILITNIRVLQIHLSPTADRLWLKCYFTFDKKVYEDFLELTFQQLNTALRYGVSRNAAFEIAWQLGDAISHQRKSLELKHIPGGELALYNARAFARLVKPIPSAPHRFNVSRIEIGKRSH